MPIFGFIVSQFVEIAIVFLICCMLEQNMAHYVFGFAYGVLCKYVFEKSCLDLWLDE